jgi:acyl-CoA reductase-like NAD-dependent aldehyde dehydrogenase
MATNGSAAASYTVPLLIDGKEVTTPTTFNVASPGTGEKVWQSSSASKEDALNAITAAEKALPTWAKTKPAERRDILLKAADLLEKRHKESFEYIRDETGALESFYDFIFNASVEMLKDIAGRITVALQGEIPTCSQEGTNALIVKEPYGVVFSIAPW